MLINKITDRPKLTHTHAPFTNIYSFFIHSGNRHASAHRHSCKHADTHVRTYRKSLVYTFTAAKLKATESTNKPQYFADVGWDISPHFALKNLSLVHSVGALYI